MGMRVNPEVFKTRNIIIGLLAESFWGLIDWSSCMALSPIGVAALSSPSMLADMFMKIEPKAGCPSGMSGKSLERIGDSSLANLFTKPLSSPICEHTSQSECHFKCLF